MKVTSFTIPAEEAAHIKYPNSTTNFIDGWVPVTVVPQTDGSLVVYARERYRDGDE